MRSACQLIGLPVFAVDSGRRLGRVRDLLVAGQGGAAAGLIIARQGWGRPSLFAPWTCVMAAGADVVMLREPATPATPTAGVSFTELRGFSVLDLAGRGLGQLADLWVDDRSGDLLGLQLSKGILDDLLAGQQVLPLAGPFRIGEAVLIWQGGGNEA